MRKLSPITVLFVVLVAASAQAQTEPPAEPKAQLSPAECEVWAREVSFAKSVADHDAKAFAEHVHADAAFGASRAQPTRGRDTIAQRWGGIVEGKALTIEWYPTRTTLAGADDVAWSSGPSLIIDYAPDSAQRYTIGGFHSVWHKDDDGVWRVLFDDGVEGKAATEAEVAAFRQARPRACPKA